MRRITFLVFVFIFFGYLFHMIFRIYETFVLMKFLICMVGTIVIYFMIKITRLTTYVMNMFMFISYSVVLLFQMKEIVDVLSIIIMFTNLFTFVEFIINKLQESDEIITEEENDMLQKCHDYMLFLENALRQVREIVIDIDKKNDFEYIRKINQQKQTESIIDVYGNMLVSVSKILTILFYVKNIKYTTFNFDTVSKIIKKMRIDVIDVKYADKVVSLKKREFVDRFENDKKCITVICELITNGHYYVTPYILIENLLKNSEFIMEITALFES